MHISLNFYLFQNNFAGLTGAPKWVLFRLKRFLLEALLTNDVAAQIWAPHKMLTGPSSFFF